MGSPEKVVISVVLFVLVGLISATVVVHRITHPRLPDPVTVQSGESASQPTSTPQPTKVLDPARKPKPMSPPTVTLQAAPGNRQVQMFDTICSNDSMITRFSTGTECAKLDGPVRITEGGASMSFYKLDCKGRIGYVNTKWVR